MTCFVCTSLVLSHCRRFCGHTHAARDCEVGPMRGFNVGGDYDWKRLLRVDWPAGTVTAEEFHG